jgi:RNA polymerase sigma-70 factor (ECF subfamily)
VTEVDEEGWVLALSSTGPERDDAERRLHGMLVRVARGEASRRGPAQGVHGRDLDDLAGQAADDAFMSIRRRLGDFRGESRFTTWAYAFAVFEVSGKLARHGRRRAELAVDGADWEQLPGRFGLEPENETEWHDLLDALRRAVEEDLTPLQRHVFVALVLQGAPLDGVAADLGATRNAVYKTMFDARRKLRASLVGSGHLTGEVAAR